MVSFVPFLAEMHVANDMIPKMLENCGDQVNIIINKVVVGAYWFHSVPLSVRPAVSLPVRPASRVRSVSPTVLFASISYLCI